LIIRLDISFSVLDNTKLSKKDNNKLANPVDIAKSEYDEKTFYVFKENDPVSTDGNYPKKRER
jgi:hypothetical protein